jgi:predicted metalloprotease with PDZ domain
MDDFCHLFHGGQSGPPEVKTYTFDDVVNTLNQVAPYDWRGFWAERLTNHGPGAPLTGIERSGWKLVYNEIQPELIKVLKRERKEINAEYSIGLLLEENGNVIDTVEGMPAAKAGIGPSMKVAAVNGKRFSEDALNDVLRAAKNSSDAIELLVENAEYFKIYKVDYHGGERYPHLVRDESKLDVLTEIIKPR